MYDGEPSLGEEYSIPLENVGTEENPEYTIVGKVPMHIKIEDCHKVRSTSPGMWQMAFDCRVFYD